MWRQELNKLFLPGMWIWCYMWSSHLITRKGRGRAVACQGLQIQQASILQTGYEFFIIQRTFDVGKTNTENPRSHKSLKRPIFLGRETCQRLTSHETKKKKIKSIPTVQLVAKQTWGPRTCCINVISRGAWDWIVQASHTGIPCLLDWPSIKSLDTKA